MTKACYELLGNDCWAFQSDYPHPEACFPDTAEIVTDWPIWQELGDEGPCINTCTAMPKESSGSSRRVAAVTAAAPHYG